MGATFLYMMGEAGQSLHTKQRQSWKGLASETADSSRQDRHAEGEDLYTTLHQEEKKHRKISSAILMSSENVPL